MKNGGHCCPPFFIQPSYGRILIEKPGDGL